MLLAGHEALSSLVDVAVQQPSLPVPHKEDKGRNPTPTEQIMALQQLRQVRGSYGVNRKWDVTFPIPQMEMQRGRPGGIPPPQQMYLRDQQMQLDQLREMEHKQREREREHQLAQEREREQRERDRQERDRQERERAIMAERSMHAERDRERMSSGRPSMYDDPEERRRYGNSGPPQFARDR